VEDPATRGLGSVVEAEHHGSAPTKLGALGGLGTL
jgi:hypothetical protein